MLEDCWAMVSGLQQGFQALAQLVQVLRVYQRRWWEYQACRELKLTQVVRPG